MHATLQVPFSMFVQNVRNNDVTALVIEGRHMGFKLRPRSLARMLPKVTEPQEPLRGSRYHHCTTLRSLGASCAEWMQLSGPCTVEWERWQACHAC